MAVRKLHMYGTHIRLPIMSCIISDDSRKVENHKVTVNIVNIEAINATVWADIHAKLDKDATLTCRVSEEYLTGGKIR